MDDPKAKELNAITFYFSIYLNKFIIIHQMDLENCTIYADNFCLSEEATNKVAIFEIYEAHPYKCPSNLPQSLVKNLTVPMQVWSKIMYSSIHDLWSG